MLSAALLQIARCAKANALPDGEGVAFIKALAMTCCGSHAKKRHLPGEMAFWDKDPGDDLLQFARCANANALPDGEGVAFIKTLAMTYSCMA